MNYYNEHDPKAAAWLRVLIEDNLIPKGKVDERDIQDVRPSDLAGFVQCHWFAGIGGWSYALRLAGWPEDKPVWTGSCPCQPFSVSGKGFCEADERHLWPDFRNLIGECRLGTVFGEQVASADGREWLAGVSANLEALAYRCGAADLCAAGVGAPHRRQRLYWVADTKHGNGRGEQQPGEQAADRRAGLAGNGAVDGLAHAGHNAGCSEQRDKLQERDSWIRKSGKSNLLATSAGDIVRLGDTDGPGQQRWGERLEECAYQWPPGTPNLIVHCRDGKARRIESETFPLADGFPNRVGLLRGSGNAIVPWLAAEFIQAYLETLT